MLQSTLKITLAAGCICASQAAAAQQAPGLAAAIDAFAASFASGEGATVASHYAADAVLLPPGAARIDGRQGIAQFWDAVFASGVTDLVLETTELDVLDEAAIEIGTWQLAAPDGTGGTVTPRGKYLVVWQQAEDGTWRLDQDIWNADPAE
ncbi:YybH family protein [Jannaschia seohaensis]|uniref:Uncharacterized protein (TIGR02246 family) n=1 Tax=Jannaschia seohaensis TaxID=475081 RepID=A0A2Y9B5E5_9RHOB|nr:SgcJ/EcaC family oxidoreductase [Jannaschia seohaensis]PWJ10039.1 uncharacterized protein (TIGR02246 family) [Jannaschia seohaensis]SSA51784.1 conserved hypothetical protein [Jannaschia seohaensis]